MARIDLTILSGEFGEKSTTVSLPVDECLMRELTGSVELSDEPFSLLLASPCMSGGRDNAITIRRRAFEMRRGIAEHIGKLMVPALLDAFGVNDKLDGYRVSGMSDEEKAWHKHRGRL